MCVKNIFSFNDLTTFWRFRNQHLVVQTTSIVAESIKRTRNENLPDWVDARWFRHTFVTTYMAFVGQTADPWDVPAKQAVLAMQKIWDATNSREYEITTSTAIYKKVCGSVCLYKK
jgi:hypothetical protein